jgi:hypothetical protein
MKIIYFTISFLLIASCTNNNSIQVEQKEGDVVSSISSGQTEEEIKKELAEIESERGSITTLSFNEIEHDYGTVKANSDNKTEFIVTNTGDKPLIIEKVDASCGCTTPKKPEKPILPGQSDVIEVIFHPKEGQLNEQKKTITVTANTEPRLTLLTIKAFVEK